MSSTVKEQSKLLYAHKSTQATLSALKQIKLIFGDMNTQSYFMLTKAHKITLFGLQVIKLRYAH